MGGQRVGLTYRYTYTIMQTTAPRKKIFFKNRLQLDVGFSQLSY